jgi:hypothetical protein
MKLDKENGTTYLAMTEQLIAPHMIHTQCANKLAIPTIGNLPLSKDIKLISRLLK